MYVCVHDNSATSQANATSIGTEVPLPCWYHVLGSKGQRSRS